MSYTNVNAYDDMVAAVQAGAASITGQGYPVAVLYKGNKQAQAPKNDSITVRMTTVVTTDRKRTLSVPSRVTKQGLLTLQVLFPKAPAINADMRRLVDLFERCLHVQTGGVVFYNAISKEMPDDSAFFIWHVQATFNYDIMEG